MSGSDYHEFRSPIPVRVVGRHGDRQPLGSGVAYGIFRTHHDQHTIWHVCFDATGEFWEVENPFVRGDPNITWGRTLAAALDLNAAANLSRPKSATDVPKAPPCNWTAQQHTIKAIETHAEYNRRLKEAQAAQNARFPLDA